MHRGYVGTKGEVYSEVSRTTMALHTTHKLIITLINTSPVFAILRGFVTLSEKSRSSLRAAVSAARASLNFAAQSAHFLFSSPLPWTLEHFEQCQTETIFPIRPARRSLSCRRPQQQYTWSSTAAVGDGIFLLLLFFFKNLMAWVRDNSHPSTRAIQAQEPSKHKSHQSTRAIQAQEPSKTKGYG